MDLADEDSTEYKLWVRVFCSIQITSNTSCCKLVCSPYVMYSNLCYKPRYAVSTAFNRPCSFPRGCRNQNEDESESVGNAKVQL